MKKIIPEQWRIWLGYQIKVRWRGGMMPQVVHPRRLPEGESEASLKAYLEPFYLAGETERAAAELRNYLQEAFYRFLYTWQIIPQGNGRLLEIGAGSYYMSLLLHRHTNYELLFTNYFGEAFGREATQSMTNGREQIDIPFYNVDVEAEPLPFETASLSVVLLCEVLEHFTNDPLAALLEIKRVLCQGGHLVLTTPNVARLENVQRMADGGNLYDPYSRYGPHGRHNREYTLQELHQLLHHAGFVVEESFTSDVHPYYVPVASSTMQWVQGRRPTLGQYCFLRARSEHPADSRKPSWLYRSYDAVDTV